MDQLFFFRATDDYCRTFDLTSRLPAATIDQALASKQLLVFDVPIEPRPTRSTLVQISELFNRPKEEAPKPVRICVPALGSPGWGDLEPSVSSKR